jgi:hypothetical protein
MELGARLNSVNRPEFLYRPLPPSEAYILHFP